MTSKEVAHGEAAPAKVTGNIVTSREEAAASIMMGEEASGTGLKVINRESLKVASKRHIIVNEDDMKKKAKGVGKKMEVEVFFQK